MLPPDDALDLALELRADIARAKAAILDALIVRLETIGASLPMELPDIDENVDDHADDKADAFSPEPLDADEFRAMVRPAPAPELKPEPDEFAVVRAAAPVVEAPVEPPKRPRRRTPPPAPAPLPGPVDEAVDAVEGDDFGSIPF